MVLAHGNGSLPITYHSSRVPSSILTRFAVYRTSLSFLRAGFNLASRSRSSISALRSIDLFLTLTDACGDSFFTGRIGRPIVVDDFSGNNLGGITLWEVFSSKSFDRKGLAVHVHYYVGMLVVLDLSGDCMRIVDRRLRPTLRAFSVRVTRGRWASLDLSRIGVGLEYLQLIIAMDCPADAHHLLVVYGDMGRLRLCFDWLLTNLWVRLR